MELKEINEGIQALSQEDRDNVSDGSHTFSELYDHRSSIYIALCKTMSRLQAENGEKLSTWKSRKHSDGSGYEGWFVLGMGITPGEQITYHLPDKYWDLANVFERERAPEWDKHTPENVIERLLSI